MRILSALFLWIPGVKPEQENGEDHDYYEKL
jgi:hypothetical protein